MTKKHKIIVSVTGASGAIYAKVLFDKLVQLNNQIEKIGVVISDNAKFVLKRWQMLVKWFSYFFSFYN